MAKSDNNSSDVNHLGLRAGERNPVRDNPRAKEVVMSSIEQLKSEAAALEAKARAQGHPMKHCDALEQVARNHGYDSWRACRAILGDPISANGTALLEKPPIINIEMKRYTSRDWNFALEALNE
jgi:hypothetical protein